MALPLVEDPHVRAQMDDILVSIAPRLARRDIKVDAVVGDGQNGAAYETAAGQVLKLTMDRSEAEAAMVLLKKNSGGRFKHLVRVYDVFQFRYGADTYYGIVQEMLRPLSGVEHEALKGAFNYLLRLYDDTTQAARVLSTRRSWHEVYADLADKDGERPGSLVDTFTEFQYPEMFSELRALGIQYADFHPGNILKRDNRTYVLIDLGASFTPGGRGTKMPDLEEAVDTTLRDLMTTKLDVSEDADERHPHEYDQAELAKALRSVAPEDRRKRLSQFGGWEKVRSRGTLVDWFKVTVAGDEQPYLDVGGRYPLYCRVFVSPIEQFNTLAQGRTLKGEGFIVDAEVYFLDRRFEPTAFVWHNEARLKTREEALARVERIKRYVDGRSLDQLSAEEKAGPLRMSKFNEAAPHAPRQQPAVAQTTVAGGRAGVAIQAVREHAEMLSRRGLEVHQMLGRGSQGAAFRLADGRVLKATLDRSEAIVAQLVHRGRYTHLARVDQVFRFADRDVFGIVREYLEPVPSALARELDEFMYARTFKNFLDLPDQLDRMDVQHQDFAARSGLYAMALELRKAGVQFYNDAGSDNMGMRGRELVLHDFGYSRPNQGEVPVMESMFSEAGGHDPDEYDLTLAAAVNLLKRRAYLPNKFLGQGANGKAYALPDGRVLKVTEDADEAKTSMALKGHSMPNVVRIDDVFRFPEPSGRLDALIRQKTNGRPRPMFGIVQERLETLPSGELQELKQVLNPVTTTMEFSTAKPLMAWIDGPVGRSLRDPAAVRRFADVCRKYQIDAMFDQLRKAHVTFADFHAKNIMRRGDQYVITDLGHFSAAPGAKEPPVLERAASAISKDVAALLGRSGKDVSESVFEPKSDAPTKGRDEDDWSDLDSDDDAGLDWGSVRGFKLDDPLLVNNRQKLADRGIEVAKVLGSGYNGTAFLLHDGRVLKVTRDEQEARAAFKLMGRHLRWVVRFFDVFRFPGQGEARYGVVMERLQPLPAQTADDIHRAYSWIVHGLRNQAGGNNPFLELGWGGIEKLAQQIGGKPLEAVETFRRYKIPRILGELQSKGIKWGDAHEENLMVRGSDIVAIDLGVSITQGASPVPVLEGKAQRVALVYARLQPPDRASCEAIRRVARSHDKVVIALPDSAEAGPEDPLTYDTRVEVLKASLPDVQPKLEAYRAGSSSLPDVIKSVYLKGRSSLDPGVAADVYASPDAARDFKGQLASYSDKDGFDPSEFVVTADQGLDSGAAEGALRSLAPGGDPTRAFDAHLSSDRNRAEELFDRMRDELASARGGVRESVFQPATGTKDTAPAQHPGEAPVSKRFDRGRADAVLDRAAEKLSAQKGIDVGRLRYLGAGKMGAAYDMGDDRVLKVTTDADEAKTCFGLIGHASQHVNSFYDVFKFPDLSGKTGDPESYYGIVQDKLEPLTEEEGDEFDSLMAAVFDYDDDEGAQDKSPFEALLTARGWAGFIKAFEDKIREDVVKETGAAPDAPVVRKAIAKRMQFYKAGWDKFQMPQIVDELAHMGVGFGDFHSGNLMKRGSEYVINDLGKSRSPHQTEPPVLEQLTHSFVESVINTLTARDDYPEEHSGFDRSFLAAGGRAKGSPDPDESPRDDLDRIE